MWDMVGRPYVYGILHINERTGRFSFKEINGTGLPAIFLNGRTGRISFKEILIYGTRSAGPISKGFCI
jgi:hypothetical protein